MRGQDYGTFHRLADVFLVGVSGSLCRFLLLLLLDLNLLALFTFTVASSASVVVLVPFLLLALTAIPQLSRREVAFFSFLRKVTLAAGFRS